MKVSVVILNWNGEQMLKKYLWSIVEYCENQDTEIVVADNGSTDNSLTFVETNFPSVKIIKLDKNYGFAGGYNKALEKLDSKYFVLCNSDILLKSNPLKSIIDFMDFDEDVAAVMPKIKSLNDNSQFEYAGAAGGFLDSLGYPFCRGRILETIEADNGQYNDNCEIFWASGAFMIVRAEDYRRVNGLDDSFFAHMEEIDFCWRLKNIGKKIYFCHEGEVFHLGGGTLNQGNARKVYLNYRNSLKMLTKNLPTRKLIIVPIRMILDGLSATVYLIKGKFGWFWAVIKAHFGFYAALPSLIKYRKQNKATAKFPSAMLRGSMIWKYLVIGNKTFNQLYE